MDIIESPAAMTTWADRCRAAGERLALVPTMGFFHDGHLHLMRRAAEHADRVVVSLFVNPTQFGPGEDYQRYPRDLERDASLAAGQGVDILFAPTAATMYPAGFQTTVTVGGLTETLCGRSRPGHFDGVTTVVAKLFHITKPQIAVFGEKDYQQLAVIRKMVRDLNWDIEIIGHPIVREADGLAMSSRNTYLTPAERRAALCLSQAVDRAQQRVAAGETDSGRIKAELTGLIESQPQTRVDYVSLVDPESLAELTRIEAPVMLLLAARIGTTRLIDNGLLTPHHQES